MDKVKFVENVKKYCTIKGVKPTVALKESGAGRSLLTNLEQNGSLPSVEKVQLLAQYLGVTTSQLLGEDIPEPKAREQPEGPAQRELREIADTSSESDARKFLDLIKLYKGLEDDALEEYKKKRLRQEDGEAVETPEPEQYFEAGTPLDEGTYVCCGCGKTTVTIRINGEKLPPCYRCNSNYWRKT